MSHPRRKCEAVVGHSSAKISRRLDTALHARADIAFHEGDGVRRSSMPRNLALINLGPWAGRRSGFLWLHASGEIRRVCLTISK